MCPRHKALLSCSFNSFLGCFLTNFEVGEVITITGNLVGGIADHKKKNIRSIHTGFNGPATGEKYENFKKEFEEFCDMYSEIKILFYKKKFVINFLEKINKINNAKSFTFEYWSCASI